MKTTSTDESAAVAATPVTPVTTFAELQLPEPLNKALADKKYTTPSPIQAQAIPHLLKGKDMIGIAQTGTGKTAAFALPILKHFIENPRKSQSGSPRALVLAPTRELAAQIRDSFAVYGKYLRLRTVVVFGGVGYGMQIRELRHGVDILIATPGRLLDLAKGGSVRFDQIEIFVLDEADRMLDMGFIHDIKKVLEKLPSKRQSLLFSATMPTSIKELAGGLLHDPVQVSVTPVATTVEKIEQRICYVDQRHKYDLLVHLLKKHTEGLVIVFSQTKHGANKIAEKLSRDGIPSEAIHGNKSQNARQYALDSFRRGKIRVLVATDIAARGIDVKGITLVVNYELPYEPESYVHRIGRTARAGAEGLAIGFCSAEERGNLKDIQKLIKRLIPMMTDHPFAVEGQQPVTYESREQSNRPFFTKGRGGRKPARSQGGRQYNRREQRPKQDGFSRGPKEDRGERRDKVQSYAKSRPSEGKPHSAKSTSSFKPKYEDRPSKHAPRQQEQGKSSKPGGFLKRIFGRDTKKSGGHAPKRGKW